MIAFETQPLTWLRKANKLIKNKHFFLKVCSRLAELESRPKSSRPRRDIEVMSPRRDRDFEQKLETRPRLERSETETRYETFETKRMQYLANIFDIKFWTFGEFPNTLQYRFLGISLLYYEQANEKGYTT